MKPKAKDVEKEALKAWRVEAKLHFPSKDGWVCLDKSKGFPDLVHFNKKTNEIVFVELKTGSHGFHAFQKQMIHILVKGKKRKALLVTYDSQKKKVINKENALKAQHDNNWEGVEDINLLDRTEMRKDRRPATGG
ncbi:MAG: hypothetical protein HZC12_03655 [Nitrospirae bacterium]|nr:hypothetical protein [Nitrospirota bacterium]